MNHQLLFSVLLAVHAYYLVLLVLLLDMRHCLSSVVG
jgi:hypothetical protein